MRDLRDPSGTPVAASNKRSPAQRHSMSMSVRWWLVRIDLPVDVVVVLEHEERARESERGEGALHGHRGSR